MSKMAHVPVGGGRSKRWAGGPVGQALGILSLAAGLSACGGGGADGSDGGLSMQAAGVGGANTAHVGAATALSPKEALGKAIFFDANLSAQGNQSCATCHAPQVGWTGPDSVLNQGGSVYQGSLPDRFGNRKPPSSAYATQSPVLHFSMVKKTALFIGGNFWDGRATGERLGSAAAEQAQGPFLNPLEQALDAPVDVITRICAAAYADQFKAVWGASACDPGNEAAAYDQVGYSIAAYEGSTESNAFTSKYDHYLKGQAKLSQQEQLGLNLFNGKGKCSACHTLERGRNGGPPLLTDYSYDNLGLPRSPDNPFYANVAFNPKGYLWQDLGLGEFLDTREDYKAFAAANLGKQKVPTLRNVDKRPEPGFVKAYGHNGYFKTLKGIVHFYNTRDAKPTCLDPFTREADALAANCWPAPEVPVNVNTKETGNLHLTPTQEDALVAFMKTLSDGYTAPAGR